MKFVVYRDGTGEYRWRLIASNGQIVASGEGYKNKADCLSTIASIQKNAPSAPVEVETEKPA
ncbi:YegP family protein [Paludisphaera rhizosphaerae]|uniref:YegP family protein n=1 Tax=Paludisphaera rhizosphaerae TaxID=2711216 RepID=UPI00198234D8|nr:DUF1508 domain-containing protein [Paludisphaera rhizosphaerae]